ncbi:hypothetical protein C8R47DRAFT_1230715 [Mycena vitilis]|nr:hypothetical protein C8R47DRAFT_1230715 [Mycena vitilis]
MSERALAAVPQEGRQNADEYRYTPPTTFIVSRLGDVGNVERGERYINANYSFAHDIPYDISPTYDALSTYDTLCPWYRGYTGPPCPSNWVTAHARECFSQACRFKRVSEGEGVEHFWANPGQTIALVASLYWRGRDESISRALIEPISRAFIERSHALVRRTDAERIHSSWSDVAPINGSRWTMMGPGVRHDSVEDIFAPSGFSHSRRGVFMEVSDGQSYGGGQLVPETAGARWARQWLESEHIDDDEAAAAWASRPANRLRVIRFLRGLYLHSRRRGRSTIG